MTRVSMEPYVFFVSFILALHLVPPSTVAQEPVMLNRYFCLSRGIGNLTNSTFGANLETLLASFSTTTVEYGFYSSSVGNKSDPVNAIGLCRPDISPDACRSCMNASSYYIRDMCRNFNDAVVYYDTCFLRYSNRSIFGVKQTGLGVVTEFGHDNFSDVSQAHEVVLNLMRRLRNETATSGPHQKYAAGEAAVNGSETVYALAQCTPDLQDSQCSDCLDEAIGRIPAEARGNKEIILLQPSCNLRYETYRFYGPLPYSDLPNGTHAHGKGMNTARVVKAIVVPIIIVILFTISIGALLNRQCKTKVIGVPPCEAIEEVLEIESLIFTLDDVKAATDNFSSANKLGRGGFGDVYKGVLSNGQEIAVKRLSIGSNQGDIEFKNEVLLLAKLQHRNLVKLFGFCLEGGEKLLIYEFLSNSSLDNHIFDPVKSAQMNWEKRYNIIKGIALGLLYLHQDSHLRIIHRDLKVSNILLDEAMNPKIADFGLAKLFQFHQTHVKTRKIAGTYGYMAPEYAYHGCFSVKSDVYSFGVMVLEIVSGRKTSSENGEESEHLVGYAWRKWNEGTIFEVVDPTLGVESRSEIMRCFHIGLLCVQKSIANRPRMPSIVSMLNNADTSLPLPSRPGFLLRSVTPTTEHGSQISRSIGLGNGNSIPFSLNKVSMSDQYPR